MSRQTLTVRMLSGCLSIMGAVTAQALQIQTNNAAQVQVSSIETQAPSSNQPSSNQRYPNEIPEHQDLGEQEQFPIHTNIDVRPNPTIQIGPGVVVGPNVLGRDKPLPNPLLKDALPQNNPRLKLNP